MTANEGGGRISGRITWFSGGTEGDQSDQSGKFYHDTYRAKILRHLPAIINDQCLIGGKMFSRFKIWVEIQHTHKKRTQSLSYLELTSNDTCPDCASNHHILLSLYTHWCIFVQCLCNNSNRRFLLGVQGSMIEKLFQLPILKEIRLFDYS